MGPVTKAIMECLKNVKRESFTAQDLYDCYNHNGEIPYISFRNRVNALCKIGAITKLERNLYRKPVEVEEEIAEPPFGIMEIGQGIVDYVSKLEKENTDLKQEALYLVQKNKELVENSSMYKNLEQQLQFLQLKFRDKHQELINKINEIRMLKDSPKITITKHNKILKSQAENSKKCIQELVNKIKKYEEEYIGMSKLSKDLFSRITTFKF